MLVSCERGYIMRILPTPLWPIIITLTGIFFLGRKRYMVRAPLPPPRGGGGALTPNFGRYVPRQKWKMGGSGTNIGHSGWTRLAALLLAAGGDDGLRNAKLFIPPQFRTPVRTHLHTANQRPRVLICIQPIHRGWFNPRYILVRATLLLSAARIAQWVERRV